MRQFVCDLLGIHDISPATLNFQKLYAKETISTEPILILISPGADPSAELRDLAIQTIGKEKYSEVELFCSIEYRRLSSVRLDCHGTRSDATRS